MEGSRVGRCGRNISPRTDWFLGPYRSAEVSKTFVLPSDHTQAKLQANFHFLDGWDEQIAYMKSWLVVTEEPFSAPNRRNQATIRSTAGAISRCYKDAPGLKAHLFTT